MNCSYDGCYSSQSVSYAMLSFNDEPGSYFPND